VCVNYVDFKMHGATIKIHDFCLGRARATICLDTPLGTDAILGTVISPEQWKYSQQWQEFFLVTVLICGPFTAEAQVRSQASFYGIERNDTVTDFSHSSSFFPLLSSHHHCSTFIYFTHLPPPWGTAVAQWLRCCATTRKVAGSIPDGVIGIPHWHNPSVRTMALGSTQRLTEMSTRSISWG